MSALSSREYINHIEGLVLKIKPSAELNEIWADYNRAFEDGPSDHVLAQRLKAVHYRLCKLKDGAL